MVRHPASHWLPKQVFIGDFLVEAQPRPKNPLYFSDFGPRLPESTR